MKKIKINFFLITTITLLLASCSDDPIEPVEPVDGTENVEPDVPVDLNKNHIACKINGEQLHFYSDHGEHNPLSYYEPYTDINVNGDPMEEATIERASGFYTSIALIEITNTFSYVNDEFATDYEEAMAEKFPPDDYTYRSDEEDEEGVSLYYYPNATIGALNTKKGDQTGSNFVISEIVNVEKIIESHYITVKGTFNCFLYNNEGELVYDLTEGTYYLRFYV